MMITFGSKSAAQVLAGKKTVTFRKWPKARVEVGEVCDAAKMGYPPSKFAKVRVTGLRRVQLKQIDNKLALRDGATSAAEVKDYWSTRGFRSTDLLWVVEFELV